MERGRVAHLHFELKDHVNDNEGPAALLQPLSDINAIFERMKSGRIDGRMVLDFT